MKSMVIGLDFDNTMVNRKGHAVWGAIETAKELVEAGHKIILYTMRSGERLDQAVEFMKENEIELWSVNHNPTQHHWTSSPKIFCDLYIDDAALGTPLDYEATGRPFVDWEKVRELLVERGYLE